MTSLQLYLQAPTQRDVPWDKARERRVLGRALEARRRRAYRRMAFELAAAMALTCFAGRALPRASAESSVTPASDVRPAIAVPAAPADRGTSLGGVAGTGGHGGTGSTGHGGNAGTG